MMSMARLVARTGYAAAEMAENWDNECREVLENEEKVERTGRSRERRRKMVRH
jgi:hypothetical protein